MQKTIAERYRYWRTIRPDLPAMRALGYAKAERDMATTLARFDSWQFRSADYGAFAYADLSEPINGFTLRVLVGDDDRPVDWGDCEPTDDEREHASAYYVAVQVLDDDGSEIYHDGIGGVDVIDLPGYLQRDWEDAAAYALNEYLLAGAERFARNEVAEAAEWAARDTITVDA